MSRQWNGFSTQLPNYNYKSGRAAEPKPGSGVQASAQVGWNAKITHFSPIVATLLDTIADIASSTSAPAATAVPPARKRIGEILIERGRLDAVGLDRALRMQQETGEKIGSLLVTLGIVAQRDVAEALAAQLELPLVEAAGYPELPILEERISARFLREARALPLSEDEHELALAMADPTDSYTISAFEMVTGRRVRPLVAIPSELEAALERLYGQGKSSLGALVGDVEQRDDIAFDADIQQLKDLASEAPVIRLVSLIITNALETRASDIHIEPFENRLIVRYRIDGVLHEIESPPRKLAPAVISRVKIMANLDIAERRLPQDGRIRLRAHGKEIDLRISTVPTMHGESVVMRILDKGGVALDFKRLGFEDDTLKRFLDVLLEPHGILLVTGPTGSGKTTTLYTALDRLNKPDVKILTVEDPVEYQMPGINQIQVKPQIDLTFANALRSIVRQDPDVIMIGEIRDLETAQIAVQSALTGHLVLSTVHTNDAPSTVNRLLDMGVEDYLLTSTVIGIQAQRLVRTLCPECNQPYTALPELVAELGLAKFANGGDITLYHAKGCKQCANTGYTGRISIIEMMPMTDPMRTLVMRHANANELRAQAIKDGMVTMYEDGMRKALRGVTTFEEVLRVTRED
jgi:general secretion pathway protein E